jgi:hypothetical protein
MAREGRIRRLDMRLLLAIAVLSIAAAALTLGAREADAQGATSQYPFCALDSGTGATSCYFSTREQCGPRCISNPGYIGRGAMASARPGRSRQPARR